MISDTLAAASGRWAVILSDLAGLQPEQLSNRHQPCPACGGRDRFRFDDRDGNGSWFCNQCGGKDHLGGGGTGMDLLMRVRRWTFRQACEEVERYLGLEPGGSGRHRPQPVSTGTGNGGKPSAATGLPGHGGRPWRQPELPPPDASPPALDQGAIAQWCYRDATGNQLFWIQRLCLGGKGRKAFLHRVWLDGGWHRPSRRDPFSCEWPAPRPLYGLPGLSERPEAPVLVVEGEGTADAAARLFPQHVVISWANGSKAIAKADWTPLAGRSVTLWPDADTAGVEAMQSLASLLHPLDCQLQLVALPADLPQGWDLADANWTPQQAARQLAKAAQPWTPPATAAADSEPAPAASRPFLCLGFDGDSYYYQPHNTGQVMRLSRSAHTATNLVALASLSYWETLYPSRSGINWAAAASDLFEQQASIGVYDPERVRGRGAWLDEGRVIFHLGDRLNVDGRPCSVLQPPASRFFYEQARHLDGPGDLPLPDADAMQIRFIAERFRWEMPASAHFLLGWLVLAPVCGALNWRPHIWLTGGAGTGKAQPHSARVLTPAGWRRMGDIEVGDMVSTPDNGFARVRGKYPQGLQATYRITFADGRSTRATGDHLWKVRLNHAWRIRTTAEMIKILATGTRQSRSLAVPLCQAMTVRNGGAASLLPLHPYALGVMLGNGCFSACGGINLTDFDQEVVDRVRLCLEGSPFCLFHTNVDGRYRLGDLSRYGKQTRQTIKDLRLLGTHSHTKFIPRAYLEASIENRAELLKGLMDTDGTADKTGGISFCTVSEQLRDDVLDLVRSLGGIAKVGTKCTFYTYNGEQRQGRTAFNISIRLTDPTIAFSLPRKLERVSSSHQYARCLYLNVVSIEPCEPEECSCIAIDHPDRLYVTDDFVVTHNTTILKAFLRPLLGGVVQSATGGTTEAGLRGILKSDAIPVVFDEFEQNEQKDKLIVQNVLALARIASSEGGKIYKGTTSGGANSFEIRSMFCVSSINVSLIQKADIDRFCVLGLRKDPMDKSEWLDFEREIATVATIDNGRALIHRTLQQLPVIIENARVLAQALGRRFGQRFGDQHGTLLAGAWSLEAAGGGHLNLVMADQWLDQMDWQHQQPDNTEADEIKCRDTILQQIVRHDIGAEASFGEMVRCVALQESLAGTLWDQLVPVLGRYGLRVFRAGQTLPDGERAEGHFLAVANANAQLDHVLRSTPWSGGAHRSALRRITGAYVPRRPIHFSGVGTKRCVMVPITTADLE